MGRKIDKNIDNPNELLYTISEVSKILKVNKNYVYALINDGHLKSIKLGCRKVTRKALLEFSCGQSVGKPSLKQLKNAEKRHS